MLNTSQQKYISDQLGTIANILFGTLFISNFLPDNYFNLKLFLISLIIVLAIYTAGIMFRRNLNE